MPLPLPHLCSCCSMVRVDGEGSYQRVSGTNIGGGTFWGLCRLLTGESAAPPPDLGLGLRVEAYQPGLRVGSTPARGSRPSLAPAGGAKGSPQQPSRDVSPCPPTPR